MENENWSMPDDINHIELDKEYLKVVAENSEKELKSSVENSQGITNRAYQLILAIVPTTTLVLSNFIKMILDKTISWVDVLFAIVILELLRESYKLLYILIFPRDQYYVGVAPRTVLHKSLIESDDQEEDEEKKKEFAYKNLLGIIIEHNQIKTDFMDRQNVVRVDYIKEVFAIFKKLFIVLGMYIATLAYLASV